MEDPWLKLWNERYAKKEYAFGIEPNKYFKAQLDKLKPGKLLLGAEGEGRNAVYAAKLGWTVSAFDISIEGQKKALQLAKSYGVEIDYQVGQLPDLNYKEKQFDVIALIYAHFPIAIRSKYHKLLSQYLKKGGILILEAFDKNHLGYKLKNPKVGGPSNLEGLFSVEELKLDFKDFEVLECEEIEIELQEGKYHDGLGHIVRFVARKK